MGQMIDEEDCEVCKPFDQEWIFTYGDLVTLLFCFFVLLVSLCKTDVEKIKQISASFKENPPGSPFVFSGQSSNLDKAAQQLEKLDVPDDVEINASDKGVEVTFRRTVSFEQGSIEISEKAVKAMKKMLPIIGQMQNDIEISGHTDDTDVNNRFPSNGKCRLPVHLPLPVFSRQTRLLLRECRWLDMEIHGHVSTLIPPIKEL